MVVEGQRSSVLFGIQDRLLASLGRADRRKNYLPTPAIDENLFGMVIRPKSQGPWREIQHGL